MTIHTQCRVTVPGWPDVPVEIELPEEPRYVPTAAIANTGDMRPVAPIRLPGPTPAEEDWPVDAPFFED